ncbi:Dos2p [Lachancea thermotolerans CBS 6340]|uniref:KLTH0H07700p n=1 Tax=Lachancea thermotolerans (strain ATCC 56472 / CBS 6340 / NRRL Y-8284) TaxID=559295 RepID=C5E2U1_LACTC|nr:KLTH0H07700p [Lachancea thermotolerans CBS 6340]CAR30352.1 KLTH0H07700p [Lachancea thermotolerans CBS 6340]
MEFFYEEQATRNGEQLVEGDLKSDKDTEKAFQELEGTIDEQYQRTARALKKFVNDERDVELNIPLDTRISEKAQGALDSLDTQLQNVEHLAQDYWKKVSTKSFWSSVTNTLGSKLDEVVKVNDQKSSTVCSQTPDAKATTPVAGNRTEAELRMLSSNDKIYLENEDELPDDFKVDEYTAEVSQLLTENKNLELLMNALVPEKLSYQDFWNIFFLKRNRIFEMERKRKELLKKEGEEDKEIDWDDEEEEPELGKASDSENKKEPNKSDIDVQHDEVNDAGAQEKGGDDNDDEDDDWE